jgi:polyhydroxyalkanoate synthesis regulator phasin
MAKKDKKSGKKDKPTEASDVVEAVREAVGRTFQGAAPAAERGRGLLEEVSSAAQRIRESFDDMRVLEDVRGLRAEIESLSRRVAALEQRDAKGGDASAASGGAAGAASAKRPSARKPPAAKPAGGRSTAQRAASAATAAKSGRADGGAPKTGTSTRSRSTAASSASSGGAGKRPAAAKRSSGS